MARAHGRTSSKESSDIGATSPGRWQLTQLANKIGATSLLKLGPASTVSATSTGAAQTSTVAHAAATTSAAPLRGCILLVSLIWNAVSIKLVALPPSTRRSEEVEPTVAQLI